MIEYTADRWQVRFLFSCNGSVFPKAFAWAMPSTFAAVGIKLFGVGDHLQGGVDLAYFSTFNFIVGFLLVFRAQHAYNRFWEAASVVTKMRGKWLAVVAGCVAFCNHKPDKADEAFKFKHSLVRLVSLLYCCALQDAAIMEDEAFEIIELNDFEPERLKFLSQGSDKCLIVLQWVQHLIMDSHRSGVLDAPPPILSRVFQGLDQGVEALYDAQKMSTILFPFPFAQMAGCILLAIWLITPCLLAITIDNVVWCAIVNFASVFSLFAINYIAAELEMPLGDDPNDLPLAAMQKSMNQALVQLMSDRIAGHPNLDPSARTSQCELIPCPFWLVTDISNAQGYAAAKLKQKNLPHTRNSAGGKRLSQMLDVSGAEEFCQLDLSAMEDSSDLKPSSDFSEQDKGAFCQLEMVDTTDCKTNSEKPGEGVFSQLEMVDSMDCTMTDIGETMLQGGESSQLHKHPLQLTTLVDLRRQLGDLSVELQSCVARFANISDSLAMDTSESPDAQQSDRPFMGEEIFVILLENLSRMGRECDRIKEIRLGQDARNDFAMRV